MSNITNIDMKNASDFKLMDRKVIETLKSMPERNTFSEHYHRGVVLKVLNYFLMSGNAKRENLNGLRNL